MDAHFFLLSLALSLALSRSLCLYRFPRTGIRIGTGLREHLLALMLLKNNNNWPAIPLCARRGCNSTKKEIRQPGSHLFPYDNEQGAFSILRFLLRHKGTKEAHTNRESYERARSLFVCVLRAQVGQPKREARLSGPAWLPPQVSWGIS